MAESSDSATDSPPESASMRTSEDRESTVAADEDTKRIVRRKPVPGKGHRKSRRGCYNCKRRRVKCPEGRPECQHCSRMGLACVYPPPPKIHATLPATPTAGLDLDHLRFFHHFLVSAHPPLPSGVSTVWHSVAALAHEVSLPNSYPVAPTPKSRIPAPLYRRQALKTHPWGLHSTSSSPRPS